MSSEQKKFAPELMGGASLLDRIRNALSSILDIGKSARIRLSRITKPDYDVIKEILDNRDSILGHRFVAKEQKRIEKQMEDFEKNIWTTPVDSAELARRDSIEAAENSKSKRSKSSASSRSSRRSNEKTVEKKEKAKSSGSSSPRVSVRRQRR